MLAFLGTFRRRTSGVFQMIRNLLFGHKDVVSSIEIRGDTEFCEFTKKALLLLKTKCFSSFDLINRHLEFIVEGRGETALTSEFGGAMLALDGKEVKNMTETWLAALLAYNAFQAKLCHEYKSRHKSVFKVPASIYCGEETWEFMYECFQKVGGSYDELQHLAEFIKTERDKIEKETK